MKFVFFAVVDGSGGGGGGGSCSFSFDSLINQALNPLRKTLILR